LLQLTEAHRNYILYITNVWCTFGVTSTFAFVVSYFSCQVPLEGHQTVQIPVVKQ